MFTERGMTGHVAWARTRPDVDVLLLHGFSDSGRCWAPVVPSLADRWGLLATDARGHGHSGLPEGPTRPEAAAEDAALALRDQSGARVDGVAVVGHSMGARTGAMLAATHPELVRALVLEDPPFFGRPPGRTPESQSSKDIPEGRFDWLWAVRALDLPARMAGCRADQPDWPDDEIEPWAVSKDEFDPAFLDRGFLAPVALTEVLAEVRCPVLFLYGDPEQGSLNSAETARQCADAAAGDLRAVHIEGAGHNVRRDRRGPYLSALTTFLDSALR